MRRLLLLICLAALLPVCACAESLPACQTAEEVLAYLLFPTVDEAGAVQAVEARAGTVRYLGQSSVKDPLFCRDYWLGGESGGELDLTLQYDAAGKPYDFYCGSMCTRATYAMALSFLGVDVTPGDMSRLMNARNLDEPYDALSDQLGVERVEYKTYAFKKMYQNYIDQPERYSPVYVYLEKPRGARHSLLVVGQEEGGRYLVIDCAVHILEEEPVYVYSMSFNPAVRSVVNCTFRREYQDSRLLGFYQWKLKEE